jgi:hypothetical protein
MRGWVIRIGIIAVILIAGFILRPFINGNAGDLKIGDCFDPPTDSGQTVDDVQHHPCTDLHGAEVILVGSYPTSTTIPTEDEFQQWVSDNCLHAYQAYTGADLLSSTNAGMGFFRPTDDGWAGGDRKMICYAQPADGTQIKGSIKKP